MDLLYWKEYGCHLGNSKESYTAILKALITVQGIETLD